MASFDKFAADDINLDAQHLADAIEERTAMILAENFTSSDPVKLGKTDYMIVSKQFAALAKTKHKEIMTRLPSHLTYDEPTESYIPCLENFARALGGIIKFMEDVFIDFMESIQTEEEWANSNATLMRIHIICRKGVDNLKSDWGAQLIPGEESEVSDEDYSTNSNED